MKIRNQFVLTLLCCFLFMQFPATAQAQVTLVGEDVQQIVATPGEQYASSVMIHNESDSTLTVRVYQDRIT